MGVRNTSIIVISNLPPFKSDGEEKSDNIQRWWLVIKGGARGQKDDTGGAAAAANHEWIVSPFKGDAT